MAAALAHKFGQCLGDFCEERFYAVLQAFALQHGFFVDRKGARLARPGKKLTWKDEFANSHDLDFVIERGGTADRIGTPMAFIEVAWRRYTKHSKNKAQEIQGAVLPVRNLHQRSAPFLGAFLVGDFTPQSLVQLRSCGFRVLYFPYSSIVAACQKVKFDVHFDATTPDSEIEATLTAWNTLSLSKRNAIWDSLCTQNAAAMQEFNIGLVAAANRQIKSVRVIPLHGSAILCKSVREAIKAVTQYQPLGGLTKPLMKYEIQLQYGNDDCVKGEFSDVKGTLEFLNQFTGGHWTPAVVNEVAENDLFYLLDEEDEAEAD